jgi:hypothetical protein
MADLISKSQDIVPVNGEMSEPLSPNEVQTLEHYEQIIAGSSGSFVETILEKWEDSPLEFCEEGEPWNPVRESSSRP